MRVQLSDPANELSVAHRADRKNAAGQGSAAVTSLFPKDTTDISATAAATPGNAVVTGAGLEISHKVADLVQQTLGAGSARSARVTHLQDSVASGEYRVAPAQIADAMLREAD